MTTTTNTDVKQWTPDFGDCEHMTVMVDWGSPGGYLLSIGRCIEAVHEDVECTQDVYPWGLYVDTTLCATYDVEGDQTFTIVDQELFERKGYDEAKARALITHAHTAVVHTWQKLVGDRDL